MKSKGKGSNKLRIQYPVKLSHYQPSASVCLAIKIQPPPPSLPVPPVVTCRKKKKKRGRKKTGECEQIIDRDNQADRHKAGQGGGGERQSAFEIRCILMSSSCSINDDLCRLQIEYRPVSERETLLTPRLSNLHLWFPLFFLLVEKNKKKPSSSLSSVFPSLCVYLPFYVSDEGNYHAHVELIL